MTQWHLVGDIGGTNARFAVAAPGDSSYQDIATYEVANFPEFGLVLDQLMQDIAASGLAAGSPAAICLAAAGPPHVETISFTNSSWRFTFSISALMLQIPGALPALNFATPTLTSSREGGFRQGVDQHPPPATQQS